MHAACGEHSRIVSILLNKGASTSIVDNEGFTPLLTVAERGNLDITKQLVNAGAPLETSSMAAAEGMTPLHMAAREGHPEVMSVLIEAGANVNSRGLGGWTPMYLAAQDGKIDAIKMLLREKADPLLTATDAKNGRTSVPLDAAARNGHTAVVRELTRQCGIGGSGGASGGVNALEQAAQEHQVDAMSVLTNAGVVDTGAALRAAAGSGREAPVKFLLQQHQGEAIRTRAYVNSRDDDGATALFFTVGFVDFFCRPNSRVVRLLVDAGADARAAMRLKKAGRVFFNDTPLALLTLIMVQGKKRADGGRTTEDQLHRLEGIRRLLLRVEAVHAASWLWHSDPHSLVRATAVRARTTTMTSPPLARMLPLLRRRARQRSVPWATLFRHSQKKS